MDVLLSADKTCFCCQSISRQPVYADATGFNDAGHTSLDGTSIAGRLRRGLQVCDACGYTAPALDTAPRGLTPAAVRARLDAASFRRDLSLRGPADVRSDLATRWFAYAAAFEGFLPPEQAGRAWACAAEELELPRLHRLGADVQAGAVEFEQAAIARRQAIVHLTSVFDAEFSPAGASSGRRSGLRRLLARWRTGERARRGVRWSVRDHQVVDTAGEARFELACLLTDLLRRVGEFVAAETVALRALRDERAPEVLVRVLSHQVRLCRVGDTVCRLQSEVTSNVVEFPAATVQRAMSAGLAETTLAA